MREIDGRGLACPQPVILTKKALEDISEGEIITIVDNEVAVENVKRLVTSLGLVYDIDEKEGFYYIKIIKKAGNEKNISESRDDFAIIIGSDKLGRGDDALGEVLMKSYIYSLTEVTPLPKTIVFLNAGVNLAVKDSPVLESLKKLYESGVEIISCGTCLDYYDLKEKLNIGIIGNMYSIVEVMHSSGKIITSG